MCGDSADVLNEFDFRSSSRSQIRGHLGSQFSAWRIAKGDWREGHHRGGQRKQAPLCAESTVIEII